MAGLVVTGLLGAGLFSNRMWLKQAGRQYPFSGDAIDGGYLAADAVLKQKLEERETKYHRIQINSRPAVNTDTGVCNLMIGNPEENRADIQVCLVIDETGEELYRSEVLIPGERRAYVALERLPEPGEHRLTAVFYLLEPEERSVTGEIEAEITLRVQTSAAGAG